MNITRVGVGIFIFKDGKFAMLQRKAAHGDGSWSVPGGHVEFGESFAETAIREAREETGMEITNIRFGALTNDFFKKENKHYATVWMLSDWKSGELVNMEPEKSSGALWCDFDSLPDPLFLPWTHLFKSEFIAKIKEESANHFS